MPIWNKIYFQNRNSPIIEHLEFFHDHSIIILAVVTLAVFYLIILFVIKPKMRYNSEENQELELFWTSIPTIILVFIAIPSLKILYLTDELNKSNFSLKTIGNQWYWGYEVPKENQEFESFISNPSSVRGVETNNQIILPHKTPIHNIISSADVLHSWTIPSLGVKADATPGRLNQIFFSINRTGAIVGQCSEICGANHSFMPISIQRISLGGWDKALAS